MGPSLTEKITLLLDVYIDTIVGNLPVDYRVSPDDGSIPSVSARKTAVGANKTLCEPYLV